MAALGYGMPEIGADSVLAQPAPAQATSGGARTVPGEILVKFKDSVDEAEIEAIVRAHGASILERIEGLGVYRLEVPRGLGLEEALRLFEDDPTTEYAEPNYVGSGGAFTPNDPSFAGQWHLDNRGQRGGRRDADIDAPEGWEITRGSSSVVVAVIDSGIVANHPEFRGRLLGGYDFVEDDGDPDADHPHGVQVTGIIAANANNGFAGAGIDHRAMILPLKITDATGSAPLTALAKALMYAADRKADVINMSLTGYPETNTLASALRYARNKGSILIACAGNGGIGDADRSAPGRSSLTISVGTTDNDDTRASFSSTGGSLDLVAPGVNVPTTVANPNRNAVTSFSGCSAATPIVSGIASLMRALDPTLGHNAVRDILIATADDGVGRPSEDTPGRDDFHGYGRVNMRAALAAVLARVPDGTVAFDLRPGRCPNRITVVEGRKRNRVAAAILGSPRLDVSEIDLASIRLAGIAPMDTKVTGKIQDVARPYAPFVGKADAKDCTRKQRDGFKDLRLHFDTEALAARLGTFTNGDVQTLQITGRLQNGTEFQGEDVAILKLRQRR